MNEFDTANLNEILTGPNKESRFNWTNAHVLRFLNIAMAKLDIPTLAKLYAIWPEQMLALYRYYDWPEDQITKRVIEFNRYL